MVAALFRDDEELRKKAEEITGEASGLNEQFLREYVNGEWSDNDVDGIIDDMGATSVKGKVILDIVQKRRLRKALKKLKESS